MKLTAAFNPLINQFDFIIARKNHTVTFQSGNQVSLGAVTSVMSEDELSQLNDYA